MNCLDKPNTAKNEGTVRQDAIPRELEAILRRFEGCFTACSYENFVSVVVGWVLCVGRRTISRVVMASGALDTRHFSALYRFFSRSVWSPDSISKILVSLLIERLGSDIEVSVDDTLCRRGGPHFFGAAMHHDSLASTYGGRGGRRAAFAFGHNWVVLAMRVPLPWGKHRGIALPVLVRLYRAKSRCPESEYTKRTQLAQEMLSLLRSWVPQEKRLLLAGDREYACQTVLVDLPEGIEFTGPIHMDAALHGPLAEYQGRGRPRVKGNREPSPRQRFGKAGGKWMTIRVAMYGSIVTLQVKCSITRWTKVAGLRPLQLIITRDPSGKFKDRAYFTTDLGASVETVLQRMAHRWLIEVCFRDTKQLFGLGDAQNGWGMAPREQDRRAKKPGPQPRGSKGSHAIHRTAPIAFLVYAITVLYYLDAGNAQQDVQRTRAAAPWYRSKAHPSVGNMLACLRGQLFARRLSKHPGHWASRQKLLRLFPDGLFAA